MIQGTCHFCLQTFSGTPSILCIQADTAQATHRHLQLSLQRWPQSVCPLPFVGPRMKSLKGFPQPLEQNSNPFLTWSSRRHWGRLHRSLSFFLPVPASSHSSLCFSLVLGPPQPPFCSGDIC